MSTTTPSSLLFFVPGLPVAQPRIKATLRNERVFIYTPHSADAWKVTVATTAMQAWGLADPWDGPVWVGVNFYLPRPKSHFRSGKYAHMLKPSAPWAPVVKPDGDNLEKAIWDALSGVAFHDDKQICGWGGEKAYLQDPDEEPGVQVHVLRMGPDGVIRDPAV